MGVFTHNSIRLRKCVVSCTFQMFEFPKQGMNLQLLRVFCDLRLEVGQSPSVSPLKGTFVFGEANIPENTVSRRMFLDPFMTASAFLHRPCSSLRGCCNSVPVCTARLLCLSLLPPIGCPLDESAILSAMSGCESGLCASTGKNKSRA